MVKGTKKQHKQLDAEYKAMLLPAYDPMAFYVNLSIMALWGEEKRYLSQYGQRYTKLVFGSKRKKK